MAGGLVQHVQISKEILMYDGNEAGELCHDRANHPMSLVPAALEDECIVDIDCFDD